MSHSENPTVTEQLRRIAEKLHRLRRRDTNFETFGSSSHRFELLPSPQPQQPLLRGNTSMASLCRKATAISFCNSAMAARGQTTVSSRLSGRRRNRRVTATTSPGCSRSLRGTLPKSSPLAATNTDTTSKNYPRRCRVYSASTTRAATTITSWYLPVNSAARSGMAAMAGARPRTGTVSRNSSSTGMRLGSTANSPLAHSAIPTMCSIPPKM